MYGPKVDGEGFIQVGVVVPTGIICELGVIVHDYSFLELFIITITQSYGLG